MSSEEEQFLDYADYNASDPGQYSEVDALQGEIMANLQYWVSGVMTNLVVVLGLVGNMLTIIILSQRAMRSSTNYYLTALAVWDSIVLICTFLLIGLIRLESYKDHFHSYVVAYIYPVALIAQTATIWLTVSFTVERYIAVCHPLRAASMCTITRAKMVIIGVSVGSSLYNIPRWFEYKPILMAHPEDNRTVVSHIMTEFSQNPLYLTGYFSCLYVPIMFIIPFLVLFILNTFLILAVRESQRNREQHLNVRQSRENNVTIMLVSVVIVFMICQLPALVYNLVFSIDLNMVKHNFGYDVLSEIRNFMVNLNSAANFILYCALGQKFRKIFLHTFCRRCLEESYTPMSGFHHHTTTVQVASQRRYNGRGGRNFVKIDNSLHKKNGNKPPVHKDKEYHPVTTNHKALIAPPTGPKTASWERHQRAKDKLNDGEMDRKYPMDNLLTERTQTYPMYNVHNGITHIGTS